MTNLKFWLLTPEVGTLCGHCAGGGTISKSSVDAVGNTDHANSRNCTQLSTW
jgi:hypothetical protein